MSMKRSRPGNPKVRSGAATGPDYPNDRFDNPFNAGIDSQYGSEASEERKTIVSPTAITIEGAGIALHDKYNEKWEGK